MCEIRWIDDYGNPTPDTNPAIGRVRVKAHVDILPDGRGYVVPESPWFTICEKHARRLSERGMHNWEFERDPGS